MSSTGVKGIDQWKDLDYNKVLRQPHSKIQLPRCPSALHNTDMSDIVVGQSQEFERRSKLPCGYSEKLENHR